MSFSASVRRLTAAAAVAVAAVGAASLPAAADDHQPGRPHHDAVFISGVHYAPPGRDAWSNRGLNEEWAGITNDSRRAVNLDDWTLSDRHGHTYTFHHLRLEGRATVRVHTGIGRDTRSDVYQDRRGYVWDQNSDTATLRNEHGRLVDEASWGHHEGDGGRDGDGRHDTDGRYGGDHRR